MYLPRSVARLSCVSNQLEDYNPSKCGSCSPKENTSEVLQDFCAHSKCTLRFVAVVPNCVDPNKLLKVPPSCAQ